MSKTLARLIEVERKLNWCMSVLQMKGAMPTGLSGPDGRPAMRIFQGSMLEMYEMARQSSTVLQSDQDFRSLGLPNPDTMTPPAVKE